MTSPKNTVPDVHFPHRPLVADTTPFDITQKQLTMFETMIFGSDSLLYNDKGMGKKKLRSVCWVRSAPSLSRDTGAAFPYSLPGMRSRTAAFFSIIYLRRKTAFLSLMTKAYYA